MVLLQKKNNPPNDRQDRLDALLRRAQSLRSDMQHQAVNTPPHHGADLQFDSANPTLELIMATDPLLAGTLPESAVAEFMADKSDDRPFASNVRPNSQESKVEIDLQHEKVRHKAMTPGSSKTESSCEVPVQERSKDHTGRWKTLRVFVGVVRIPPRFAKKNRKAQQLLLRLLPSKLQDKTYRVADTVCQEITGDGTALIFNHQFELHLDISAKLKSLPLPLQLYAHLEQPKLGPETRKNGRIPTKVAEAQVNWSDVLEQPSGTCFAMLPFHVSPESAGPVARSSRASSESIKQQQIFGRADVTISLCDGSSDASCNNNDPPCTPCCQEPQIIDMHLRVWLGKATLRDQSFSGVHAVFKLGPSQEVSIRAVEESNMKCFTEFSTNGEVRGHFYSAAISGSPTWQVDAVTGESLSGPSPTRLFIQLWRGSELLGIVKVSIDQLDAQAVLSLKERGGVMELQSRDMVVKSAAASLPIGTIHVMLHAGVVSALSQMQMQLPATGITIDESACISGEEQRQMLATATLLVAASPTEIESIISLADGNAHDPHSEISLERMRTAILLHVKGLSSQEATILLMDIASKCDTRGNPTLQAQVLCQALRAIRQNVETAVDSILQEIGDACSKVTKDLINLGVQSSLRGSELLALLRNQKYDVSWEAVNLLFERLGFSSSRDELPAWALAQLFERRAEVWWRDVARAAELEAQMLARLRKTLQTHSTMNLFEPYVRSDGTIDSLALTIALEVALKEFSTAASSVDMAATQSVMFSWQDLELVASGLIRRMGDVKTRSISLPALLQWAQGPQQPETCDSCSLPSASGHKLIPVPQQHNSEFAPSSLLPIQPQTTSAGLEGLQRSAGSIYDTFKLAAPLRQYDIDAGFASKCAASFAHMLAIAKPRVQVSDLKAGSPDIAVAILSGPSNELDPSAAMQKLRQFLNKSKTNPNNQPGGGNYQPSRERQSYQDRTEDDTYNRSRATFDEESFQLPVHAGARQLLIDFSNLLSCEAFSIDQATEVLNVGGQACFAENTVRQNPVNLSIPGALESFMESNRAGVVAALTAWQNLLLPTSADAAVIALHSLVQPTNPERQGAGIPLLCTTVRALCRAVEHEVVSQSGSEALLHRFFHALLVAKQPPEDVFETVILEHGRFISFTELCKKLSSVTRLPSVADMLGVKQVLETNGNVDIFALSSRYSQWHNICIMQVPDLATVVTQPAAHKKVTVLCTSASSPPRFNLFDLPSFLVYAMLEVGGHGSVSRNQLQSLGKLCCISGGVVADMIDSTCAITGDCCSSYSTFRQYFAKIDRHRAKEHTVQEMLKVSNLRGDIQRALELVQPSSSGNPQTDQVSVIVAALSQRGRSLASVVDASGVAELLGDFQLPFHVATVLVELLVIVSVASMDPAAPSSELMADSCQGPSFCCTYSELITTLQRAHALLLSHLNDLLGACFVAGADLSILLDFAQARSDRKISSEELTGILQGAQVDLAAIDLHDALSALDHTGCGTFSTTELIDCFELFRRRHHSLLLRLTSRLQNMPCTLDRLLARAEPGRSGGTSTNSV